MTRCASCGFEAGFPMAICPSCGARATSVAPAKLATDGRTVLLNNGSVGASVGAKAATGCFLVLAGPDRGKHFLLASTGLIGRGAEAGVALTDPRVSTRHAHFRVDSGRVVYQDLQATNGSFLVIGGGRKRLKGPHVVSDGDEIELGNTVLRYILLTKGVRR